MYYVYILKSIKSEILYIGYTSDLRRRFKEHQEGRSKYTSNKGPYELIYYEAYKNKTDAVLREKKLKQYKNTYAMLKKRISKSLDI